MKNFKNNSVTRRLCALILSLAFCIGMFGVTTAFAAENNTNGIVNHVICSGSSYDYISDNYKDFKFHVGTSRVYYVSYFYENYSGNLSNKGRLVILNSNGQPYVQCTLDTLSTGGSSTFTLESGTYTARVYPGEKPYMFSFNIYWKEVTLI